VKMDATTVSDGKKARTSGVIRPFGVSIAGMDLGLDGQGVAIGGNSTKLPDIPSSVTDVLDKIGISFSYAPTTQSVDGATGSLSADAMVISIDTQPLKTALNVGGLVGPLQDLIEKIPKLGSQIGPLLGLGPQIVFRIGDVTTTATAAPAYVVPPVTPSGGGGNPGGNPGGSHGTGGQVVPPAGGTGGGVPLPGVGGGTTPPTNQPPVSQPTQPTSFSLPKLGTVPKILIVGGLLLAAASGWLFRTLGGFLLGGARNCSFGLSTGVPDLRKG